MLKKQKIVIVEDEAIIAQYLKMEMEFAGYIVNGIYSNGKDCIEAAKEMDTDVFLMDINLNGPIDGIDTAKEILVFKKVAIIFMTGFSEELIEARAMKLNPAAFLNKPVEIEDLMPVLEKITEHK
jgi:DNA-binding NtrC family response regulator